VGGAERLPKHKSLARAALARIIMAFEYHRRVGAQALMKIISRNTWLWMLPLLIVMTWLASRHLFHNLIWLDERHSFFYAGLVADPDISLFEIPLQLLERGRHPPLYYMFLRVWLDIFGQTSFHGRLLSLFVGLLATALTYRAGLALSRSQWVGLGAAYSLGLAGVWIHHMHEMRMYTVIPALAVIVIWAYWHIMTRSVVRPRAWWVLGLALWTLIMVYYLGAIFAAVLGLYHLLFGRTLAPNLRRWWRVLWTMLLLPWYSIWVLTLGEREKSVFGTAETMNAAAILLEQVLALGNLFPALIMIILVLACVLVRGRAFGYVAFLAGVTFAVILLISQTVTNVHNTRNLMVMWPPLVIVVGYGIYALRQLPAAPPVLLIALFTLGVVTSWDMDYLASQDNAAYDDMGLPQRLVALCSQPDEPLHISAAALDEHPMLAENLDYYHNAQGHEALSPSELNFSGVYVWFLHTVDAAPSEDMSATAARHDYKLCTQEQDERLQLHVYATADAVCPVWQRPDVLPACARYATLP